MFSKILKPLSSLKLAVFIIAGLGVALAIGTVLESSHGVQTARFWIYDSFAFTGFLALLGVNISAVAFSRWPWRRLHIPFLLAHLGILLVLVGSIVTRKYGIDGSLRILQGQGSKTVQLEQHQVVIITKDFEYQTVIPWRPEGYPFRRVALPLGLEVAEYLTHARSEFGFTEDKQGAPAIRVQISGAEGPMSAVQDAVWLWQGLPDWQEQHLGPLKLSFNLKTEFAEKPWIAFQVESTGKLQYRAEMINGQRFQGEAPLLKSIQIGKVKFQVLQFIPNAKMHSQYRASRKSRGQNPDPPAIRLMTSGPNPEKIWMGLGDQVVFSKFSENTGPEEVKIHYETQKTELPFSLKLNRFEVDHYEGTEQASAYRSWVEVDLGQGLQPQEYEISMNEPLNLFGYTFYQSSFESTPVASIFTVSKDPGRFLKYFGSFLIVLGSILLFIRKAGWFR